MVERVNRDMVAIEPTERVMAGRIMLFRPAMVQIGSPRLLIGSHWSLYPTRYISPSPTANTGKVMPSIEPIIRPLSTMVPRFAAAVTPSGMAMMKVRIAAATASCSVRGSASITSSKTGRLLRNDVPRSP